MYNQNVTATHQLSPGRALTVTLRQPFSFIRVDAEVDWCCSRCGNSSIARVPVLVDWCDRRSAQDQRQVADGLPCPACYALEPLHLPLLQYRRGDAIGLMVGFPADADLDGVGRWVHDILLMVSSAAPDLEGVVLFASVRMAWWASVWNRPLGPRLLGVVPLQLPESAEEIGRWRNETVAKLALTDIEGAVAAFLRAPDRDAVMETLIGQPELLIPRLRLTVDTLLNWHCANQETPEAEYGIAVRAALLRQARLCGLDALRRVQAGDKLRPLFEVAALATDPAERLAALRAVIDAPGPQDSALRIAAHLAYVQRLHGATDRRAGDADVLIAAARRAVDLATAAFGPDHELSLSARLNLAVCLNERVGVGGETPVRDALEMLEELAPKIATMGTSLLADVAINLATVTSQRPEAHADNPEDAGELLADAHHIGGLFSSDERRTTITALVDEAVVLRSKLSGSRRENAARAVEMLNRAAELEEEWKILLPPERVLIATNRSNALTQLHEHAPEQATAGDVRKAASAAITATGGLERHNPVAIQAYINAGVTLIYLYGETQSAGGDRALWEEAHDVLERAAAAAAEALSPRHPLALSADLNLAIAYGPLIDGEVADRGRCAELLQRVIDNAHDASFTMIAASNLAQLRLGGGEYDAAADAYAIAAGAHRKLFGQARTLVTKLGEVISMPDLAARRALTLVLAERPEEAVAVLEENRTRLSGLQPAAAPQPSESRTAILHVASCAYGTLGVVRLPEGGVEHFCTTLSSQRIKPVLTALLEAGGSEQRREHLDALMTSLGPGVIEPVAEILDAHAIDELVVVACGTLASCPLHGVPDAGGRRWIDRFTVRYRVSAFAAPAPPQSGREVLAVTDPDGTLPFARAERDAVRAWAGSLVESPPDASLRSWLLRALPSASVAHLACHGELDPEDAMRSRFKLGAESEITVADLAELITPDLALVVAPACQSASASPDAPDELLGVGHALVHAGARIVIASLWDADDAVTALVISRLYAEMTAGADPAQALTGAQRYVATITGPGLAELSAARLDGRPDAAWLPYDLAVEFSALSAHPAYRSPSRPCFGHPADWATLSCLEG